MRKLEKHKRILILHMLVEGMSMRATSRVVGCSINTVVKLLHDAGHACARYHDQTVRNLKCKFVQCDEIWAFCYAKNKTIEAMKDEDLPDTFAGDVWTWTALDPLSKLMISYEVGDRSGDTAWCFIADLRKRLNINKRGKVHLTTDGHTAYFDVIRDIFAGKVDYMQVLKFFDEVEGTAGQWKRPMLGDPDFANASVSFIERQNLNIRMGNRRFTRLTNAFSKRIEKHLLMLHVYFVYYNFIREHMTLETAPAVEAGLINRPHTMEWMIDLIDSHAPKPNRPKRYKKKLL